uniref:Globin family profile domain-containing protein n=1 Tax=Setaria digitata TaxID=48799 RepID=A0A915PMS1_9BILA
MNSGATRSSNINRRDSKGKGRCRSFRRTSALAKLTAHQQQALFISWKALRPTVQTLMRKILNNLEEEMPRVKQIFCKTAVLDAFNREGTSENPATLEEHIKLMIGFFDDIVSNIQDEENLSNKIKKVGQSHAVLGNCSFSADIWEKLGEITMECFSIQDVVQKTREAGKAWRILIAWITDELRCGFDGRTRFNRRNLSLTALEQCHERTGHHRYSSDDTVLQKQLQQLRLDYESTVPL